MSFNAYSFLTLLIFYGYGNSNQTWMHNGHNLTLIEVIIFIFSFYAKEKCRLNTTKDMFTKSTCKQYTDEPNASKLK